MKLPNGITVDTAAMATDTGIPEATIRNILSEVSPQRFMRKITLTEELDQATTYAQVLGVYRRTWRFAHENKHLIDRAYEKLVAISRTDLISAKTRDDVYVIHARGDVTRDPQLRLETFTRFAEFFIVTDE